MSIPTTTIVAGSTTLTLGQPLLWTDEFTWRRVQQSLAYSITGQALRQATARQGGQPVTLTSGGWITRAELETLRGWADQAGLILLVSVRGEASSPCHFDHEAGAIDAAPVHPVAYAEAGLYYRVTLRFRKV